MQKLQDRWCSVYFDFWALKICFLLRKERAKQLSSMGRKDLAQMFKNAMFLLIQFGGWGSGRSEWCSITGCSLLKLLASGGGCIISRISFVWGFFFKRKLMDFGGGGEAGLGRLCVLCLTKE